MGHAAAASSFPLAVVFLLVAEGRLFSVGRADVLDAYAAVALGLVIAVGCFLSIEGLVVLLATRHEGRVRVVGWLFASAGAIAVHGPVPLLAVGSVFSIAVAVGLFALVPRVLRAWRDRRLHVL